MSIGNVAHPRLPSDNRGSGRGIREQRGHGDMANVCRTLFGSSDHELNSRFLMKELQEMRSEQRRRWNFDFETETPLPGRFQWVRVKQPEDKGQDWDESIPPGGGLRFRSVDSGGESSSSPSKGLCNGEHKIAVGAQRCNCGQAQPTGQTSASSKGGGAVFFKQTRVTEYLRKRKCKETRPENNKSSKYKMPDDSTDSVAPSYRHITTRSLSQMSPLQASGESRN